MKTTIHWLGGWASSLSCWEPLFQDLFPDFEHRFLETHELLEKSPADAGLVDLPARHIAAGWSMGSLLAHHWMQRGLWPKTLPFLSICPIFQFLRPVGFGQPIILKMEEKIETDRETVLRDFWRRMPKAAKIPSHWEETWITGTRRYSDAQLIQGLEFLRNTVIDPASQFSSPFRWELLAGKQDALAPIPDDAFLLPNVRMSTYEGGHVPFWECPEEIHAALTRLMIRLME